MWVNSFKFTQFLYLANISIVAMLKFYNKAENASSINIIANRAEKSSKHLSHKVGCSHMSYCEESFSLFLLCMAEN